MPINYRHPNRPTVCLRKRDRVSLLKANAGLTWEDRQTNARYYALKAQRPTVSLVKTYADPTHYSDGYRLSTRQGRKLDDIAREFNTVERYHAARRLKGAAPVTVVAPRHWLALAACVLLALITFAAATPSTAAAAAPYCAEDMPCFEWSTMGGLQRGVILKTAPRDCKWSDGWSARCITTMDAADYCRARRAGTIDRKRTASLKGDKIARDHGCDASVFAQPASFAMVANRTPDLDDAPYEPTDVQRLGKGGEYVADCGDGARPSDLGVYTDKGKALGTQTRTAKGYKWAGVKGSATYTRKGQTFRNGTARPVLVAYWCE